MNTNENGDAAETMNKVNDKQVEAKILRINSVNFICVDLMTGKTSSPFCKRSFDATT